MTQLTDIGEIYARLTMLEFAIEVFLANELSFQDEAVSESFRANLIDRSRCMTAPDGSDETMALAMRSTEMMENLMRKVADRENSIRRSNGEIV